jgi:hypothetical protein
MTFSITTLSIMALFATLIINDIQHNAISFIMLSHDYFNVVLSVIMLRIVAPLFGGKT